MLSYNSIHGLIRSILTVLLCSCATTYAQFPGWVQLDPTIEGEPIDVEEIHLDGNGRLYARTYWPIEGNRLFVSTDRGLNWQVVPGLEDMRVNRFFVLKSGTLLVAVKDRLLRSQDMGRSWDEISKILAGNDFDNDASFVDFQQTHDGTVYRQTQAYFGGSPFISQSISKDDGLTWESLAGPLDRCGDANRMVLIDSTLVVCVGSDRDGKLWMHKPGERSWQRLLAEGQHREGSWNAKLVRANSRGDILVATTTPERPFLIGRNKGTSWNFPEPSVPQPPTRAPAMILSDRHDNFIVLSVGWIWYTDDLAQSWTQIPRHAILSDNYPRSIRIDPDGYLYVLTREKLFRTEVPLDAITSIQADSHPQTSDSEWMIQPNPVRDEFTIDFELGGNQRVQADIYDIYGRHLARLFNRQFTTG